MTVQLPHFGAIVIKANIEDAQVRRLLVNNRSFCDILFLEAFSKMGIDPKNLNLCSGGLVGFMVMKPL